MRPRKSIAEYEARKQCIGYEKSLCKRRAMLLFLR